MLLFEHSGMFKCSSDLLHICKVETKKSSCVNTRGILTAAYQVFHMLSYPGEGVGILARGWVPWGTPLSRPGRGIGTLAGG